MKHWRVWQDWPGSPGSGEEVGTVTAFSKTAALRLARQKWATSVPGSHGLKKFVVSVKADRTRRNASKASTSTASRTRTSTSTKATTTGNKTGTSTGGAVSGGGGNITVNVKRNPPKGFIPCKAVKITRNKGRLEVRIRK